MSEIREQTVQWLSRNGCVPVSEFGGRVAELLTIAYKGTHHIPNARRVNWGSDYWIEVNIWDGTLATFYADLLTRIVILCHDLAIRMELRQSGRGMVKLCFSHGEKEGALGQRHATIETAVAKLRAEYMPAEVAA